MTDFEFFVNSPFTDRSILPVFDSLEAQNDYFDAASKTVKQGIFKAFDTPILVHASLKQCIGFSYFRFKRDDIWYYCIATDVREDTPQKCYISFRLDYWQTARYQFGITLGRGYVNRSAHAPEGQAHNDARYMTVSKIHSVFDPTLYPDRDYFNVVYFRRTKDSSGKDRNTIGIIVNLTLAQLRLSIFSGSWVQLIGSQTESEIIGAWFIPGFFTEQNLIDAFWVKVPITPQYAVLDAYEVDSLAGTIPNPAEFIPNSVLINSISNKKETYVIRDMDGSILYQFEMGRNYGADGRGIYALLDVSPTSCQLKIINAKFDESSIVSPIQYYEQLTTMSGQSLDVFTDAYAEYFARQRQFDLDQRALNTKKNVINGITGAVGTGIEGAMTGALVGAAGGPIGAAGGALLGAGFSIGGALVNGALESGYYNPQEQRNLDNYYKNAVDTLSIIGSHFLLNCMWNHDYRGSVVDICGLYLIEPDPETAAQIDADIETFGEYCTIATDNGESWVLEGALRGTFIIKGAVPELWKGQIQKMISDGVTVTKYGE